MKQLIIALLKDACFFAVGMVMVYIGAKLMWIAIFGGEIIIETNKFPR